MIISPPFLPTRTANQTDAGYVVAGMPSSSVNCPQTSVPEGSHPISLNMGWHGGTHYQAPSQNSSVITVRAIADGEIVFARKPKTANTKPEDPLNYNPYGTQPTWTDDGLVIIKHTTDIGTAETATGIVYYSLISHLAQLKGNAAKVAAGTATAADKKIYRKDEIGNAGQIYGGNASNHIHMEIVCDDDNLQKILGRQNLYDDLDTSTHGRADAIYGEIYFRLPIGTKLYQTQPADNIITPAATNTVVKTIETINIIGLRYCCGEAPPNIAGVSAGKGGAVLTTYLEGGSIITNGQLAEIDAEYNLYKRATHISKTYQDAHAPKVPAPSAVYELLRFGRIINTDNEILDPADTPHWRKVKYDGGEGWVNLNQTNITIYSDADFPPWKGWRLIHDDLDGDSRCNSAQLINMIEEVSQADGKLTKAELIQRMGLSTVRAALKKTICAFPSEWVQDTIDARWDWLKTDPEYQLEGESWDNYRKHVEALTVSANKLPDAFSAMLWHFEPSEFVKQFRQCGWLSEGEFAQCFMKNYLHLNEKKFISATIPWETALARAKSWAKAFNICCSKYNISASKHRLVHFLSHVIPETGFLRFVKELGADDAKYAPYYGRGLIQLTHKSNYSEYGLFRRFPISKTIVEKFAEIGWNPDELIAKTNDGNHNAVNCVDSACFYIIKYKNMLGHMDSGTKQENAIIVSKDVNGYVSIEKLNGLDLRLQSILFLKYTLMDDVNPDTESLTFDWRRSSKKEIVINNGKVIKKYMLSTHNLTFTFKPQRP